MSTLLTLLYSHYHGSSAGPIALGLTFIAVLIILAYIFSRRAIVRRNILKHPFRRLQYFQEGEVARTWGKVIYTVPTVNAPLSGRACAYYYVRVEEYRSNGKSSSWVKIIEEEHGKEIILQDGNYFAMIETDIVKSYVNEDRKYSSGFGKDASPGLEKFLNERGNKSTGFFGGNRSLRYFEGIVEKGEQVSVAGKGNWSAPPKNLTGISSARMLRITNADGDKVYFTDDVAIVDESLKVEKPIDN